MWEGRFKSQALLDEAAVLSCMAYVDLNPVRAGIAEDAASSDFTSIQQRLFEYARHAGADKNMANELRERECRQQALKEDLAVHEQSEAPLMALYGSCHEEIHRALPFTQEDYFDLVDQTGRAIRGDRRGFISSAVPPIVSRLGMNPDKWLEHVQSFSKRYAGCAGSADRIRKYAEQFKRNWGKGTACSQAVYRKDKAA